MELSFSNEINIFRFCTELSKTEKVYNFATPYYCETVQRITDRRYFKEFNVVKIFVK